MGDPGELTDVALHDAIIAAAATGELYDCGDRELAASWLRELVVGAPNLEIHPKGVRITNASDPAG